MKSIFSKSQGNCVDVTKTDNGMIRVRDTERKTGDVDLLFTRDEWEAFTKGVMISQFKYENVPYENADREIAYGERVEIEKATRRTRRTPENIAYVNGRHAEKAGWVPYSYEMFCRRFGHEPENDRSRRLYESFQTGRRAEALEKV